MSDASVGPHRFDVCIIGGGAAGLLLAEELSRDVATSVAIIEAGPDQFSRRREPYTVRSLLKRHLGVNEGRVTALGGATNTWGGGLIRLCAADFEALSGRPDTAWPIDFDSLTPHYQAIEERFEIGGGGDAGTTLISDEQVEVRRRPIPVLSFGGKNFAHRFGPVLRARTNVTIMCETEITAFECDSSRRLSRIEIKSGSTMQSLVAHQFVVTAGVVNTNLLARRILQANGMKDRAQQVGHYFHDHISFPVARLHPVAHGRFSRAFGYRFAHDLMFGEHFDIHAKGAALPGGFLHFAFDTTESAILRPVRDVLNAIQRKSLQPERWPSLQEMASLVFGLPRLGFYRYLLGRLYLDPGTKILATLDLEQVPQPDWFIGHAGDSTQCGVSWEVSDIDAAVAARFIPACRKILSQLRKEADFTIEELVPDPDANPTGFSEHLREHAIDTLHSSGGLRMGTEPSSLVEPTLRLGGVQNVYVLSTAVFPRVGTSNPTLTLLALGDRLAAHLRSELSARIGRANSSVVSSFVR